MPSLDELSKNKFAVAAGKLGAVAVAMLASYLGARFDATDKAGVVKDHAAAGYSELAEAMKRQEQAALTEELRHREAIAYLTGRLESLERVLTKVRAGAKKPASPPPSPQPPLVQQLKQQAQMVGPQQQQSLQTATIPDSLDGAYEKRSAK